MFKSWKLAAHRMLRAACVLTGVLSLAGCASQSAKPESPKINPVEARYSQLMRDAENALEQNQRDQALGLFANAAKTNPARKEPWLRIAQIQFERGYYVEAAAAAQETLQRDAGGKDGAAAYSIMAVSGLRLSVRALAELRGGDFLKGDVRHEAETLAQTLRVTLNEPVLVPQTLLQPETGAETNVVPPPATPGTSTGKTTSKVRASPQTATQEADKPSSQKSKQTMQSARDIGVGAVSGDPFGALK